ncbi:MAG TPA: methionine--tRNA ligase subunit beta [Candidatus Pacearchaeota archaeon]|nr:methionine--tRNA ligase subunit beta [Candidatus Pacearchaeota archaeon]HQI74692.1 methionine--tRNA ligase subunit beta [Candidatus Pacearchaeota archaeon]
MITIEDILKLDLRTAKVLEAQRVQGSEKLIKIQLSLGDESRQIVAGIGKAYEPEQLIGKTIIIVANLEPRDLMGNTSNGMLLAATGQNGLPVLLIPDKEIESGARIK